MKTSKICDTSIRVLQTLKFLSENSASIQDIISYFEKIDPNNRIYTSEVILKYINTLKVFGFRFKKEKDKYVLLNMPVQFDFVGKDLSAIYIIEKVARILPESEINVEITKFLQDLEQHFSDNTKLLFYQFNKNKPISLNFNYKKYEEKIKQYEKYCLGGQRLKIIYISQNKKQISSMVEPNEIKYQGDDVYLSVYNPLSAQIQDINFNSILSVEQLPSISNPVSLFSSVTFELKDRLAHAYRLHESEKLLQVRANGNIVILNQKEDHALLLKRLMRYAEYCEIISPKSLREEMKNLIKSTLSLYE